jgi:hypothetical protein
MLPGLLQQDAARLGLLLPLDWRRLDVCLQRRSDLVEVASQGLDKEAAPGRVPGIARLGDAEENAPALVDKPRRVVP